MGEDALFNLRWDAQRSALLGSMASLYREEAFVDTTIVADNKIYKAHKLLLSASSSYLKQMLESVPSSQHAVIFMPHISAFDLGNLLKFIYDGEIKINKRSLKSFLSVAKLLKIKGMDFELNEDLDVNIPPSYAQYLSTSLPSPSFGNKRSAADDEMNGSCNPVPSKIRATPPKENGFFNTLNASDEESSSAGVIRPAPITCSGRSTDSTSPPASNNNNTASSPNNENTRKDQPSNNNDNEDSQGSKRGCDDEGDVSDGEEKHTALNLHIGRYHANNDSMDNMDNDSRHGGDEGDEGSRRATRENGTEDDYDDNDDDDFSMSIQPEVSIRESDESFNLTERRHSLPFKSNFANPFSLSFLGGSSMSITQTPGGGLGSSLTNIPSPLAFQQHLTLKQLSKYTRPTMVPPAKAHQLAGQGSPQSGSLPALNEGILMRMMREPLPGNGNKSLGGSPTPVFFDMAHNDPNLQAGLRKQKRYVQCTSCSKVLSSLSALKRHMEDVHCARIQGKCLLCGRVYSSRNSLLTHVYSAHKKHHDYKAVARIIRESDFEQFATA